MRDILLDVLEGIDRYVTLKVEKFSQKIASKGFPMWVQACTVYFSAVVIVVYVASQIIHIADEFKQPTGTALMVIIVLLCEFTFPGLLESAHKVIDPVGYSDPDKEFGDGYEAWSSLVVFAIQLCIISTLKVDMSLALVLLLWLTLMSYIYFAERTEHPSGRRRKRRRLKRGAMRLVDRLKGVASPQPV